MNLRTDPWLQDDPLADLLRLQAEYGYECLVGDDPGQLIQSCIQTAVDGLKADYGMIWERSAGRDSFVARACAGLSCRQPGLQISLTPEALRRLWLSVDSSSRFPQVICDPECGSSQDAVLGVVIPGSGAGFGVLEIGFRRSLPIQPFEKHFVCTLTTQLGQALMRPKKVAPPESAEPLAAGDATILVVEDDPNLGCSLADFLEGRGYRVLRAENWHQALSSLDGGGFDLLLADVGVSGSQWSEQLRHCQGKFQTLFMSGYPLESIQALGIRVGEQNFLQKPFSPIVLQKRLGQLLSGSLAGAGGGGKNQGFRCM